MNDRARLIRAETMIANVARHLKGSASSELFAVIAQLSKVLTNTEYVDQLPPTEQD